MTKLYLNIKARRKELKMSQDTLALLTGYTDRSSISKIEAGKADLTSSKIEIFAKALKTSPPALMWGEHIGTADYTRINDSADFFTFPVIGDVAAGYDSIALEDYDGETVDIPRSYLKGRHRSDFFVLRVKGESMYPAYKEGDKVLVLRQSTLNRSGQVGVVMYNDELSTLKKVEFVMGENWLRLVPLNPSFPPVTIENEQLEHCKVLGIPKLIIREVDE